MPSLRQWLESLGLEQYADRFELDRVDFDVLGDLSEQDLEKLGVALGDRKRLLKAIRAIAAPAAEPAGRPATAETLVERRQVSVLFVDLSGYTQLTSTLGAEATHALVRRFREIADRIVVSHGGAVERYLGDAVMAVFGLPVAHGNDSERALRAAQTIHEAMPGLSGALGHELRVHAGIASGQVIASRTVEGEDFSTVGDAVNLAARLVALAAPGETVLSESVQRAAGHAVEAEPIGEVSVKGFVSPVRAWRVRAWRPVASGRAPVPVVGRAAELEQFGRLCRACASQARPHVVLVRGEAGIGKTRLIEEFEAIATAAGFAAHKGLTLDFGMGRAQDAVGRIVASLLGGGATGLPRQAVLDSALAQQLIAEDERMFAADLMDVPLPDDLRGVYDALADATRAARRRELVVRMVQRASLRQPVLLVVEDIHWGDEELLEMLAELAAGIEAHRALLVMTSRPEGSPQIGAWRSPVARVTLDLGPLPDSEALALARALGIAGGDVLADCVQRAGGNPLFLEQLLRNAAAAEQESVPGSIQSLVLARLDRLDPRDRRAVQAASVLGQRFALPLLRHLLADPDYSCTELIAEGLLRPMDEELLFAHALIWEGTYVSLLSDQKRAWHMAAAQWHASADPALAAEHLERAGDERAARTYLEAARAERAAHHIERALHLLERAARVATRPEEAFPALLDLGELLQAVGQPAEAIEACRQAFDLAADDLGRMRALIGVASALRMADRREESLASLDQAQDLAANAGGDAEWAQIHYLRGGVYFPMGRVQEGLAEQRRALEYACKAGAVEMQLRALSGLGDAHYAAGRLVSSHEHFRECVETSRRHRVVQVEAANLPMVSITSHFMGRFDDSLDYARAGLELSRRLLNRRSEMICHHALTMVFLERDEIARATEHAQESIDISQAIGAKRFEPEGMCFLADCLIREGRSGEAHALLLDALDKARNDTISYCGPWIMGELAAVEPRVEDSLRWLREGEEVLRAGAPAHNHIAFYADAIDVALRVGDWAAARRYAGLLEDYFREEPVPLAVYFVDRGRALAAAGEGCVDRETRAQLDRLVAKARTEGLNASLRALAAAAAQASPAKA